MVVRSIPAADALFALLAFPRIHGWRRRDVLARDFATLSQLVETVPAFEVTIPWGPPFAPDVAATLADLARHEVRPGIADVRGPLR